MINGGLTAAAGAKKKSRGKRLSGVKQGGVKRSGTAARQNPDHWIATVNARKA
jgi:hypothetical protein